MRSWWLSSTLLEIEWSIYLQHTTLTLTGLDRQSDRSHLINQLVLSIPSTYMAILFNLHLQQIPNPCLLGTKWQWLRVNCIKKIGIWPLLKTWNQHGLENLLPVQVYWPCIIISTKVNGFLSWYILDTSWTLCGWWSPGPAKKKHYLRCL